MSLIVAREVSKSYGPKTVMSGVSLRLAEADRIGLVGPNGEGKTTLLRMLADIEPPTTGKINRSGRLRIGYLPQDPPALDGATLWQSAQAVFAELRAMETELHDLAGQLGDSAGDPFDPPRGRTQGRPEHGRRADKSLARFGELQTEFESRGGYALESRIKRTLSGLGFGPGQYDQPVSQLSGGQRSRALLANLLLADPDVLLLDEPTNHLDLEATEWLENWLTLFKGTLIVVSHDRYLLDRVTNKTWEVAFGKVEEYRGNYTAYVALRDARYDQRLRAWKARQEYVERAEEFIRRTHYGLKAKQAKSRRALLDRLMSENTVEKPRTQEQIRVKFAAVRETGNVVMRAISLVVGYDPNKTTPASAGAETLPVRTLLKLPDSIIESGQRIAIIGPNGSGKTTLLRTLLGEIEALGGKLRLGANVRMGYLPQTHDSLDPNMTALDVVRKANPKITPAEGRSLLGSFLFHGDDVFKTVGELSGGQRSRIVLARLVTQGANVLMLDEPTNHLDITSQEVLTEVLQDFGGTVILVSHDRYLVQAVATHIWAIEQIPQSAIGTTQSSIRILKGGWAEFVRWRGGAQERRETHESGGKSRQPEAPKPARINKRLIKRQAEIEAEIQELEARLRQLAGEIDRAGIAGKVDRVHTLGVEYQSVDAQLRQLWSDLTQVTEQLETP